MDTPHSFMTGHQHSMPGATPARTPDEAQHAGKLKDPVCGMWVDPATARGGVLVHDGQQHAFCNPRCREKFLADPGRYLSATAAPTTAAPTTSPAVEAQASSYVCPMHPEVVQ